MDLTADYTPEQALYYGIWDALSVDSKDTPAGKNAQRLYGVDTVGATAILWDLLERQRKAETFRRIDFEDGDWVRVPASQIHDLVLTCGVNTYTVEGRVDGIDSVRLHARTSQIVVEGPRTISMYEPTDMVEVASRDRMNG